MGSGVNATATGKYAGTGAAQDVKLPFAPKAVLIVNLTDSIVAIKSNRQADENHTQIAQNGAITQVTTEGITIPETEAATKAALADFAKFSLGTDAGVNASGKDCMFIAFA